MNSRLVEIQLKDGKSIQGKIIGHIYGDKNKGESFIRAWHIVSDDNLLGVDAFGFDDGIKILQSEILQINFLEDKSFIKFV